jgi:FAD/FMN-containing dehydrogenase
MIKKYKKLTQLKHFLKRKGTVAGIIVIIIALFTGKKVMYLAAEPEGDKDCLPVYPEESGTPQSVSEIEQAGSLLPWEQKGGTINDASCLDETNVYGIIRVTKEDDIKQALKFAQDRGVKVSIAGVKHSMGGQAFFKNALVLDMTKFNQIVLNEQKNTMMVQTGATWHDIQNFLHPKFAVKAMQSTDIFTVGGSISVNAHGMDHQVGAVGKTIKSMHVMLTDGTIKTASPTENVELFRSVIGGYGLFGIVLDAEIEVTENVAYETKRQIIDYKQFPEVFNNEILPNKNIGLMYSHLSTAPNSFLKELIIYRYEQIEDQDVQFAPLGEVGNVKLRRFIVNFSKQGSVAQRIKWFTEKYVEPRIESCTVNRNQALKEGEACLVARNDPMHDSVPYLRNSLKNDTDILHEYFIPRKEFIPFVDGMRKILQDNKTNLLNASVRVVHKEDIVLNYAPEDMFSIVLYINQTTDAKGNEKMKKVTQELIDLTNKHNGKFFLPYQLHYSPEQLVAAYPQIPSFFEMKKKYDPKEILTNTFYEKYSN